MGKTNKINLGINIDHVATLRNARKKNANAWPDVTLAAQAAISGGADLITFHLREDRRHIIDADLPRLKKAISVPINFEMAVTSEMLEIALKLKPHQICLVPEKRQELTTEGGLNVVGLGKKFHHYVEKLNAAKMLVAPFIDPEEKQVKACVDAGACAIELHTGAYAESIVAGGLRQKRAELKRLVVAANLAAKLGLKVHAGHGLDYENVTEIAAISEIDELNIGHYIIGEALFTGLTSAVRKMKRILTAARAK